ncbi:hypothetical protein QP415_11285, partial [Pauljensenia sp. UMB3104]|uniref:hypothetical protein n=1 Tax=Pauljensenia sp. UMB3104 TaxID=3046331 RepID=UPI002549F465
YLRDEVFRHGVVGLGEDIDVNLRLSSEIFREFFQRPGSGVICPDSEGSNGCSTVRSRLSDGGLFRVNTV